MLKPLLRLLGIALAVLVAVLLYNTFRTKAWPVQPSDNNPLPLPDSALLHLSRAVQLPTVSFGESLSIDTTAFDNFDRFIGQAYPLVHQHLSKTAINRYNYVFEWRGQNAALPPIILMGHYDVVPVEGASLKEWTVPPFSGLITDSCVWGRGAVDDKCGVIAILEATEDLLRKGFRPQRSIYICLGHDEEILGHSAEMTVQYLAQQGVHAEMVLDEGGEITEEKFKEFNRPLAVIGVAEKGYASFELTVQKAGGHSMMPEKETAIDILTAALQRLRSQSPPAQLTPPVKEFLHRISASSDNFLHRMAGSNTWLLDGAIKGIISAKPEGAAMIHTTIVPTILEAGVKDNIIPAIAKAVVNTRILPGETAASVEAYIRTTIHDDRVQIKKISRYGSDPSPATDINSSAFKRVERAIYKTIPRVLPAPYLMIGGTDSRYFRRISDGVVNFLPMTDSRGYHGINERLPVRDLQRSINFIRTVIEDSTREFR